jgi:hypothetical protein
MEKKFLIAVMSLGCITLAAFAYAQTTLTAKAPSAAPAASAPVVAAAPKQDAGQFNTHKQKLLDDLGDHIAKMQKKQSCIQAAADEKALSACLSGEKKTAPQPSGKQ